MSLPLDVTRCLDAGCPERHDCMLWLERYAEDGRELSWAASLFPYDLPLGEPCPAKIKAPARSVDG